MNRIVTVLTDFGLQDGYVAAMKGVLLSLAPSATIVDGVHDIVRHDILSGAWALGQYWRLFPEGTIHIAVVDPGVGSERQALLVEADGHFFLAPDNGLMTWVLRQANSARLRALRSGVRRTECSSTFHGRDIFAYAAGLLLSGRAKPEDIADETRSVMMPSWAMIRKDNQRLVGEIVHVDHFGNLITNIMRKQVAEAFGGEYVVQAGPFASIPLVRTYADGPRGELIALYGSSDTLELAISSGSAAETPLRRGTPVIVRSRSV